MNKIIKKAVATVLVLTTALSFNITALAESIGSSASDPSVGMDEAQGVITEYKEITPAYESSVIGTDVYLTNDTENILVSVPKKVVLSGTFDSVDKKYKGKYTVKVEGDFAGDKSVNIVPNSTVNLIQQGKKNTVAKIAQDKTQFWFTDITNGTNTANGVIEAEHLTAGSWNGVFNFNVSLENSYKYYSTLEKAVADANNLTTKNADIQEKDKDKAIAAMWVNPIDNIARIQLINNSENTPQLTLNQNTEIDLMQHTIDFIDGANIVYNKNLSLKNGSMIGGNTTLIENKTNNTSELNVQECNLKLDNGINVNKTTGLITSVSKTNNIYNVSLTEKSISDKQNNHALIFLSSNPNSINNTLKNVRINSDIKAADKNYLIVLDNVKNAVLDNIQVEACISNFKYFRTVQMQNNSSAEITNFTTDMNINRGSMGEYTNGIAISSGSSLEIDNSNINIVNTNDNTTKSLVGIITYKDTNLTVNKNVKILTENHGSSARGSTGLVAFDNANLEINSSKESPVLVYGNQGSIQTSQTGKNIINGGIYKSDNHTGYILGNAEIHDAIFECTGNSGFGFYCGSRHNGNYYNNNKVNIYNSKIIGNPKSTNGSGICATWNISDYGNVGPKEINLYDTEVYAGGGRLFYYNVNINEHDSQRVNKCTTEFHLYGNSKIYDKNKNEISKETLANTINTWKTTVRGQETPYYVYFGNSIIDGRGWYDTTTQTSKCWNTPEANVYDHRPASIKQ